MDLVVCPGCSRHAFADEAACPYCGVQGKPTLLALLVALGLTVTACSSSEVVAVYGPAPVESTARTVEPSQSAQSTSTAAATGTATSTGTATATPPVDVYGPPPRDPNQRR